MNRVKTMSVAFVIVTIITAFMLGIAFAAHKGSVSGTVLSISDSGEEMMIRTEVLGIMGPETRDVKLSIDRKTKLTICWAGDCDTGPALKGLRILKDFEHFDAEGLSCVGKEVTVFYTGRGEKVAHIKINYPAGVNFQPYDFISPF